jgi:hypothetical protein
MNTSTRRTLIIRRPDLNNFERYKIDPEYTINRVKKNPAFHQFLSKNPLPYYIGSPKIEGGNHQCGDNMEGGSFLSDFADGFKKGFTTTLDIGSKILPLIGLGKKKRAAKKKAIKNEESEVGTCASNTCGESASEKEELAHEKKENKKLKKIKKVVQEMQEENKKMIKGKGSKAARGELVRKLMKEKKMTLGQASKHIKDNKLI